MQINTRIAGIEDKMKKLDVEVVKYRDQMNKMRPGPAQNAVKQKALRALKQKKMYEAQLNSLMTQSFNMEQTSFTQQTLSDTALQVSVMKQANQSIKAQFKEINVDEIDDLHDDLQDLMDTSNEIQEIMSRQYEMPYDVDEGELEEELMTLEADLDADADAVPSYLTELQAPTGTINIGAQSDALPDVPLSNTVNN